MTPLLLDTHVLLWWLADHPKLGTQARTAIANPVQPIVVSAASIWEIGIKRALGKLEAPLGLARIVDEQGFTQLVIAANHAELAGQLPNHHNDPFDRMLIAQAQAEGMIVVTSDEKFQAYGVRLIHAHN